MSDAAALALDALIEQWLRMHGSALQPYDPEWPSLCAAGPEHTDSSGATWLPWRPVRRPTARLPALDGLERALETPLHADIRAYYERWWSGPLEVRSPSLRLQLILLWNEEDADRLVENLIGHALDQRRRRVPFSAFLATTEPAGEEMVSIDNTTGEVVLELPGGRQRRTLARSLASFLPAFMPA
ncbi:MAG: SecY-interacting protein Syd [Gammaproteobacteria bacterium]